MAKRPTPEGDEPTSPFADTVKASAQQIWLAGLGAFSKAQEEGGKVFEALVREGVAIQRRTQEAAETRLTEATSRMAAMATELSGRAAAPWDKLGPMFEQQLARGLKQLGMPSAGDLHALEQRVAELERKLAAAGDPPARRAAPRRAPARPAGPRAPRPRAARKTTG